MDKLEVRLLGGFELARGGAVLDQLPLRAARSLFAFLVLNRDRAHTRDLLAGTFWPDFDDTRARKRLSQALWQVQTTLGEDEGQRYLIGTPDTIRFNPEADFRLDVDDFEDALDEAKGVDRTVEAEALGRAVDLYRGDLLAGFYDDWLFPDQDRLRTRFLGALERLADLSQARGDYETALTHARRLAQEDEFDEEAHRRVMRLAVLLGRHNEAIRQFDECRRVLAEELGTEPSSETMDLYEATLADRDSGGRSVPPHEESPLFGDVETAPFVGREGERAKFAQRLDEVLEGSGGIVLVEGESGVGKTRLLAEVVDDAKWRGMDVVWGRSAPSGGRPFGPLGEALRSLSELRARQLRARLDETRRATLAPLIPRLGTPDQSETPLSMADERTRMHEAIGAAFQGLATTAPTLVVLEDVHWSDEDTIQALAQLAHRIDDDRILFAVSYRHGEARERHEVWDLLRTLDRLSHCERISLSAYSPAQTEELIRRSLGLPEISSEFSERLHRETGGIPLFIVETLRALYERDSLDEAEAPAEEVPPTRDRLPVTPTVHALIRHRLEGLEPGSRRTLELVASHDGDLLLSEIVAASELTDDSALAAIDDLQRRRFVDGTGTSFSVGHELMRRVVYDDLNVSRRLDLHRRIAQAVEASRPDEVELLAHHFETARMPDRAAAYLERAAERAIAVHAYDTAALHLARASHTLDEIGASDDRKYGVAALHEEVLDVLGRRSDQEHVLSRMQRFASEDERGEVLRRRAWWLAHQDRFQEAEEVAGEALELARESDDGGKSVAALTALGMIACYGGRAAEGVVFLEEAADYRGTDRRQEANARNALGQNLIDLQRFGEAESQLLAALALYGELGDARGQAEVLGMLATLRMERGEPEAAEADFLRAIETSERIGYRHGEAVYRMNLAILYVITNRLAAALEAFDAAAAAYAAMGNQRGRALVLSNAAWMRYSRLGDVKSARTDVDTAIETYEQIGDVRGLAQCHAMLGSILVRNGEPESAWSLFEQSLASAQDAEDQWLSAQISREFANSLLEVGELDRAQHYADLAARICERTRMDDLIVGINALRSRILLARGDISGARKASDAAMSEMRDGTELAHLIHYTHALVLLAEGNHALGHRHIDEAHKVLRRIVSDLSAFDEERALREIPEHAAIVEHWRTLRPDVRSVKLAWEKAPTGRALEEDEYRAVEWTLSDPSDLDIADKVTRRRRRIVRLVAEARAQGATPTVVDLADALDASQATIRRDLAAMREEGSDLPTRGSRSTT